MRKILNYIDGELREPVSGLWIDNIEPATGQVYSLIPDSDEGEVEQAVKAAKAAFPGWAALSIGERSDFLIRIADRIDERAEELALGGEEEPARMVVFGR